MQAQNEAVDPVCGMKVNREDAQKTQHKGRGYFFCSDQCRKQFQSDPEKYISQAGQKKAA